MPCTSTQRRKSSSQPGSIGLIAPIGMSKPSPSSRHSRGEARVHRGQVLVQERVEAAGPGLRDPLRAKPGDEGGSLIERQAAERPSTEGHVGVDQSLGRGG